MVGVFGLGRRALWLLGWWEGWRGERGGEWIGGGGFKERGGEMLGSLGIAWAACTGRVWRDLEALKEVKCLKA